MRTKILLFFILLSFGGVLSAQDTIRQLIISEARLDEAHEAYVELTNMGDSTLHLKNFEFGIVHPWTARVDVNDIGAWFQIGAGDWFMLPDWTLAPGKSIVIAAVRDWTPKMWLKDQDHFDQAITKPEMWKLADIQVHMPESPVPVPQSEDSISSYQDVMGSWQGRACWYVRHHVAPGDSVVVDQVGGVFTDPNGQQAWGGKDVAGVSDATESDIIVRKFSVKTGNTDFNTGRGTSADESEWIPIPIFIPGGYEPYRAVLWTVGNHVDAHLDAQTLVSSTVDVNFADSTMSVAWGIRRDDSIMYQFARKPGLGWHYDYVASHEDSAFVSVRTGDVFKLWACGINAEIIPFKLTVAPPPADANIVIPKNVPNSHLTYVNSGAFCQVTDKVPGMDTIRGNILYGIAYATRVDSLLKYLEKAPNATWEIVFVDGLTRPDLKNGDILRVTAEDGVSVKDYFIKVAPYKARHNANLSFITWPDISVDYRGTYGWAGDTISGFLASKLDYKVVVPYDVDGIPALLAKNEDINAKLEVDRAKSLDGSDADKTVTFTSTAEDNTTVLTYHVQLEKGKELINVQPYLAEPFISQYTFRQTYSNDYLEIVNPGTQPLDLSHYMFTFSNAATPAAAITNFTAIADWGNRYSKYIPGLKWQNETLWGIEPAIAVQDLSVDPNVLPGDVFVIADVRSHDATQAANYLLPQIDVDFANTPWGDTLTQGQAMDQWWAIPNKTILFKILNDSVYNGIKPATDPADFKVIDMFGYNNNGNTNWVIGGKAASQVTNWIRKPYIYKGNPEISTGVYPGGSFGTDWDNSEWIYDDEASLQAKGYAWPNWRVQISDGLGSHFMVAVSVYKSTVTSPYYKLSPGYSLDETLDGVKTGTTVTQFLANLYKADTGQHLSVLGGGVLGPDVELVTGDTLQIVSQDSVNTTRYLLTVGAGLSSDAVLTSSTLTVGVSETTGTVSGFEYGSLLKDIIAAVQVPTGAHMTVIDANNAYVPLKFLNYDTVYVDTKVSDQIFLEVLAEDGITKITYQLNPTSSVSDAFVTSDIYNVNQELALISLVPKGATVYALFRFLTPAPGATMKLMDKGGVFERTEGTVAQDDKLVVTAADGTTKKTYYLQVLVPGWHDIVTYLAYVLSDVYPVDQLNLVVGNNGDIITGMLTTDLLANLTAAPSATLKIVNSLGVENSGALMLGDLLEVTAGNGVTKVIYTIDIIDAVNIAHTGIKVYPNPSSGTVYVAGIEQGYKIVVSNILGQQLFARIANQDRETISLKGQPSGIYFIELSNNNKVISRYKLILK